VNIALSAADPAQAAARQIRHGRCAADPAWPLRGRCGCIECGTSSSVTIVIRMVATGTWLYDGTVPTVVRVIESDCDFWFDIAEADGDLPKGEEPRLNESGLAYYLRYRPGWEPGQTFWPDSKGFMSVDAAKAAAEARVPGEVSWA
jgi:hypothetical protein